MWFAFSQCPAPNHWGLSDFTSHANPGSLAHQYPSGVSIPQESAAATVLGDGLGVGSPSCPVHAAPSRARSVTATTAEVFTSAAPT